MHGIDLELNIGLDKVVFNAAFIYYFWDAFLHFYPRRAAHAEAQRFVLLLLLLLLLLGEYRCFCCAAIRASAHCSC